MMRLRRSVVAGVLGIAGLEPGQIMRNEPVFLHPPGEWPGAVSKQPARHGKRESPELLLTGSAGLGNDVQLLLCQTILAVRSDKRREHRVVVLLT